MTVFTVNEVDSALICNRLISSVASSVTSSICMVGCVRDSCPEKSLVAMPVSNDV